MVLLGLGQLVDGFVRVTKNGRVYMGVSLFSHICLMKISGWYKDGDA